MAYSLVKLTPTTRAAEVAAGDVLFDSTEFQLPAKTCKLVSVTMVDFEKKLTSDDFTFIFHQDNAGGTFGASGAAEALSVPNAILNVPMGMARVSGEAYGAFANFNMFSSAGFDNTRGGNNSFPIILERDDNDRKMYAACRCEAVSTAGTLAGDNADGGDLAVYLGFEY